MFGVLIRDRGREAEVARLSRLDFRGLELALQRDVSRWSDLLRTSLDWDLFFLAALLLIRAAIDLPMFLLTLSVLE
jgi:hypothetical protein